MSNCQYTYSGSHLGFQNDKCTAVAEATGRITGANEAIMDTKFRDVGLDYARDHLSRLPAVIAAEGQGSGASSASANRCDWMPCRNTQPVVINTGYFMYWALLPGRGPGRSRPPPATRDAAAAAGTHHHREHRGRGHLRLHALSSLGRGRRSCCWPRSAWMQCSGGGRRRRQAIVPEPVIAPGGTSRGDPSAAAHRPRRRSGAGARATSEATSSSHPHAARARPRRDRQAARRPPAPR